MIDKLMKKWGLPDVVTEILFNIVVGVIFAIATSVVVFSEHFLEVSSGNYTTFYAAF